MSEYTPSTGEVRRRYAYARSAGNKNQSAVAEFDRWLAAHDAEVRAGVVAEEPEWEYGIRTLRYGGKYGFYVARDEQDAKRQLEGTSRSEIVRRRKAGPWVPVEN